MLLCLTWLDAIVAEGGLDPFSRIDSDESTNTTRTASPPSEKPQVAEGMFDYYQLATVPANSVLR